MNVGFNWEALGRTRWYELLARFALGGAITVATGLTAKRWGPEFGGLFLAFPAIFPAAASLLEKHQREAKRKAGIPETLRGRLAAGLDARGAFMGSLGGLLFAFLVWKFLSPHHWVGVILAALLAWGLLSTLLWWIRKHHPWARPDLSE